MIVFLDLDDTLWRFHQIPDSAKSAIKTAHKNGHKLFVNTGRTNCEVPHQILNELPFDGFCFASGSEIVINNHQVHYKPLNINLVKEIIPIVESLNIGACLEGSKITYQNEINYKLFQEFAKEDRTGNDFFTHSRIKDIDENGMRQIMKVSLHSKEKFDVETILKKLPNNLIFTPFGFNGGEITHKDFNKATAIQFVKNHYNTNEETMAVGDSENDLTMLKEADISVAMGNGKQVVKDICDYTTSNIDEDGIYNAFKHFNLI